MARPKPTILLENVNKQYKAEQVLNADAIYAVFYQEKPINLRTLSHLISYPGPKYKKVSFSNSGHAFNWQRVRARPWFNRNRAYF